MILETILTIITGLFKLAAWAFIIWAGWWVVTCFMVAVGLFPDTCKDCEECKKKY